MTDQIPKPPIDKQAFLKSANEVRVILESEGKIPNPVDEQPSWLCWNLGCQMRNTPSDSRCYNCGCGRGYMSEEVQHLITQEKRKLLDEVAERSREYSVSDAERYEHRTGFDGQEMVPLSVIEGLRRKV